MARRRRGIPGLSFSWRRATGVTSIKRKIARATGIPTTRSGRRRKIGRMMTGGGCLFQFVAIYLLISAAVTFAIFLAA